VNTTIHIRVPWKAGNSWPAVQLFISFSRLTLVHGVIITIIAIIVRHNIINIMFDSLRNYDLILSCSNFITYYSRRLHRDALFLVNVLKGNVNYHSIVDTCYSCAHKANKRIFYFQREQFITTQFFCSVCHYCKWHMKIFGHFWQKHCLLWGHFLDTRKCLDRYVRVSSLVLFSFVFYCFLLFFFILSSCADSVIGSCSCWVSTLISRIE
jgi:hypothetical protein